MAENIKLKLIRSNKVNDPLSDDLIDQYVIGKWAKGKNYLFGQLKDIHEDLRKRNIVFFIPCREKGKDTVKHADLRHFIEVFLLEDVIKDQGPRLLDQIREPSNKEHAEKHLVHIVRDLGTPRDFGQQFQYLNHIVRVHVDNQYGNENFAMVISSNAKSHRVLWLLTRSQVLEYAARAETSPCSCSEVDSAGLGERELIFTDWTDRIHADAILGLQAVALLEGADADTRGASYFCRYACKCLHEDSVGEFDEARIHLDFSCSWTLRAVARGDQPDAPFATRGHIAAWITAQTPCQVPCSHTHDSSTLCLQCVVLAIEP
jgi:hypothetical protein